MSAYIALGYMCNHKCKICPLTTMDKFQKNISLQTVINSIEETLHNHPIEQVVISGGEPTLSPILYDVLDFLAKKGLQTILFTNADNLSKKEVTDKLIAHVDIKKFHIISTIHHSTPAFHDFITQNEGSFQRTLQGLMFINKAGIGVTVKHVINKHNHESLECFASFVIDNFPPSVSVEFCGMDYCGSGQKNISEFFVTYKQIQRYLETALDFFERHDNEARQISIIELPLCTIDPYYWKYFPRRRIKNLELYTAPNAGNDSKYVQNVESECNSNYSECDNCVVKDYCEGCWVSAYRYQSNLLTTIKEA